MYHYSPPTHAQRPKFRRWLLIVTLACLSGCSLKLTYPYMDWWLSWTIRDYVTLNRPQRQHLETRLDNFHRWHQQTQLKHYLVFVEQLATQVEQPMSHRQLADISLELQQHWLTSLDYLLIDIDQLFISLSDQQWQLFLENLDQKQKEYSEPFLSVDKQDRLKLRQKRFTKGTKRWIGKLTKSQKEMVEHWSKDLHPITQLNAERQSLWNQEATQLFSQRHQLEAHVRQKKLRALVVNDIHKWPEAAQESILYNQKITYQLLLNIHQSLTEKQLKTLKGQLRSYRSDFRFLVSQSDKFALSPLEQPGL